MQVAKDWPQLMMIGRSLAVGGHVKEITNTAQSEWVEYWREVDGFYFTVRSSYGGTFPTEGPFRDFDTAEEEAALVIGEDRAAIACYEED